MHLVVERTHILQPEMGIYKRKKSKESNQTCVHAKRTQKENMHASTKKKSLKKTLTRPGKHP